MVVVVEGVACRPGTVDGVAVDDDAPDTEHSPYLPRVTSSPARTTTFREGERDELMTYLPGGRVMWNRRPEVGLAKTVVEPLNSAPDHAFTCTKGPGPPDPVLSSHAGAVPTTSPLGVSPLKPRTNGVAYSVEQPASGPLNRFDTSDPGRRTVYAG